MPDARRIIMTVFLPFALGYFMSYLFRAVNAVVAPYLERDLGASATDLGLLTSAYFFSFAAFQIPLGLLLDRYGPRRVEAGLLLFAVAGALIFAFGGSIAALTVGRAMIGLGVSGCLMAAVKANALWWPAQRQPLINGCILACGGVGALIATEPVAAILELTPWPNLFLGLALLSLLASATIWLVVPEHPDTIAATPGTLGQQLQGVRSIFASRLFWAIAPANVLSQATFLAYQTLWAAPWLRDVDGRSTPAVAEHLLYMAAAVVAGFLLMGGITERLGSRGIRPITVIKTGQWLFVGFQIAILAGFYAHPLMVWLGFGFFGTTGAVIFAVLARLWPRDMMGRVSTALNMLVFGGAFAAQYAVGLIIDLWPAAPGGGYVPAAHQTALGVLVGLQILGQLWMAWSDRPGSAYRLG